MSIFNCYQCWKSAYPGIVHFCFLLCLTKPIAENREQHWNPSNSLNPHVQYYSYIHTSYMLHIAATLIYVPQHAQTLFILSYLNCYSSLPPPAYSNLLSYPFKQHFSGTSWLLLTLLALAPPLSRGHLLHLGRVSTSLMQGLQQHPSPTLPREVLHHPSSGKAFKFPNM